MNHIILEDINYLIEADLPYYTLCDQTILVTGATGLLGFQIVCTFLELTQKKNYKIKVIALVRNKDKAEKMFYKFNKREEFTIIQGDINTLSPIESTIDYIFHCAGMTDSKSFIEKPIETISSIVFGSHNIFELARKKKSKGIIYLSSLEVYGITDFNKPKISENDYGYLDILNIRSSYSESKRLVETMSISYEKEYGVPIKIVRLCQTFGAGVSYTDNRVFAQFARSIIEKKDIIIHTKGETVRSYCYTRDAIKAIFYILFYGQSGTAYNVANEETTISIYDMAYMLSQHFPKSNVIVQNKEGESYGYNPKIKICLDTNRIQQIGWKPEVGLLEMYKRMIQSMCITKDEVY